jgi:hypothetical protein
MSLRRFDTSPRRLVGALVCLSILIGLAAPAAPAVASEVTLATQDADHPLQVRPRLVSYTGDGTGYLAGRTTDPHHLGRDGLHWRSWKAGSGFARGYAWINNCRPSCANGHFSKHRAGVRVRRPRSGHFTRMTIRYRYAGRHIVDHRALQYIPPSQYGDESFPGYFVWGICGGRYGTPC